MIILCGVQAANVDDYNCVKNDEPKTNASMGKSDGSQILLVPELKIPVRPHD